LSAARIDYHYERNILSRFRIRKLKNLKCTIRSKEILLERIGFTNGCQCRGNLYLLFGAFWFWPEIVVVDRIKRHFVASGLCILMGGLGLGAEMAISKVPQVFVIRFATTGDLFSGAQFRFESYGCTDDFGMYLTVECVNCDDGGQLLTEKRRT